MWKASRISFRSVGGSCTGCGSSLLHSSRNYHSSFPTPAVVSSSKNTPLLLTPTRWSGAARQYPRNHRTFQSGSTKAQNSSTQGSGGANSSTRAGSSGTATKSENPISDRITIDPKTRMRMELRQDGTEKTEAITSNSNKWDIPHGHKNRTQDSPYNRAYEEIQNRQYSRSNNQSGNMGHNQPRDQGRGRQERYIEKKARESAPASFATSSAWGFGAPKAAPKPKPSPQAPAPTTAATMAAKPSTAPTPKATTPAPSQRAAPQMKRPPTPTPAPRSIEKAKVLVEQRYRQKKKRAKAPKDVFIPDAVTVTNLAGLLGARIPHFERTMANLGMEITRHDHMLTAEEASLLALEYNVNPIMGNTESLFDLVSRPEPEDMSIYPLRPPVVTIMGHVDHGKTTLLDSLRKTSVAAGEAGGITQHIGAFSVTLPSKQKITFLDTPGHAAFSAMRARGAHTTDIVVLVVAAEDGVMPQTIEAVKHAEEADVPIIVAINKCDKYGADPEKAKQALLQYGVTVEDLGGDTQAIEVSGLTGKNLDKLEEAILTLSEVLDLRAEVNIKGEGHVIESLIERGRGNVATVLVKRGTLRIGDMIVAGDTWCKVKAMVTEGGNSLKEALPGTPVKVMGWKDLPKAGDEMLGAESEEQAKLVVSNRQLKKERKEQLKTLIAINEKRRVTAEEEDEEKAALKDYKHKAWMFHQGMLDTHPDMPQPKRPAPAAQDEDEDGVKNLRMVVKGDVSGTVEAVCDALSGLPDDQVKVSVIQSGVGNISEGDIQFASSCGGMVLGFNVKSDKKLQQTARQMGVTLKSYSVIYKLLDDVKVQMATLLPKDIEIQVVGEAKIAQVFNIKLKGGQFQNVAGCRIVNGGVTRKEDVRIVRDGEVVWDGRLSALKRVKEDIQEAKKGTECGMEFEGFEDFREGDVIQSIKKMEVLRKL